MTTYRDLLKVSAGIRQCVKLPGRKFAVACVSNHKLIQKHMNAFNEQFPQFVDGFEEVQLEFNENISKFGPNENESKQEYEKAFKEKHADIIAKQEGVEQEKDAALDTEVPNFEGWKKIRNNELPETITVEQLDAISELLV